MCQKENDVRTPIEDALFRHALGSLDVIYAHRGLASFLSTRLPEGVIVDRGYGDRGWCARRRRALARARSRTVARGARVQDQL